MRKTPLIVVLALVLGFVLTMGGLGFAEEAEGAELNLAIVHIQEVAQEQPALEMHFETFTEVVDDIRQDEGYDLVFTGDMLLAGSEDMVDDITPQVQEEFGEEVEDEEEPELDFDDDL